MKKWLIKKLFGTQFFKFYNNCEADFYQQKNDLNLAASRINALEIRYNKILADLTELKSKIQILENKYPRGKR